MDSERTELEEMRTTLRVEYNPLRNAEDVDGDRPYSNDPIGNCPCPCPKISAPIWMAGFVPFSPLA